MSENWNDCMLVAENGEFNENFEFDMMPTWQTYCNIVGKNPRENVWYDTLEDCIFGAEQTFYRNPEEFSFFSQKENFHSNSLWGARAVLEAYGKHFSESSTQNEEMIYLAHPKLSEIKGKDILIVGAGPTAGLEYWKDTKYDQIWSCTNFFKNPVLSNMQIDLASIGGNVALNDPDFEKYINKFDTLLGFEGGVTPYKDGEDVSSFLNDHHDRCFYFHTRYFSKLGAAARLICLATLLGARKVYFAGFDGYPVGQKHSFEGPNKKYDEPWRNSGSFNVYRRQVVLLWDYLLQFDTEYINLGKAHEANQSRGII
jgi:hypothetical protein